MSMPSITPQSAVILSVGDEQTLGQITDTNSGWLSARLIEQGILTRYHKTVPDDLPAIVKALREAAGAASLIIITGGLGPTQDDLTRQAIADAAGVALELHAPSLAHLEQFFKKLNRHMPEQNRTQALGPKGGEMLDNDCGTAPGIRMTLKKATLVAMPGVPHEMKAMFNRHVLPMLKSQQGRVILTEVVRTFGIGEGSVGEKLGELMKRGRNPQVGTTVSGGVVSVRIRSEFPNLDRARREMESVVEDVRRRLGQAVFGTGDTTLQQAVARQLQERRKTVATAESCTGGLIAKMLTDTAGASAWFRGGWVVYSTDMKRHALHIPSDILAKHGAVSEPVAKLLAENARQEADADYGLATTGIAGPDGGTSATPEGTIWIALAKRNGQTACVDQIRFPGDRDLVRERAAKTALHMLRLALME
jgi:nicotinamide-nucleotide amidase